MSNTTATASNDAVQPPYCRHLGASQPPTQCSSMLLSNHPLPTLWPQCDTPHQWISLRLWVEMTGGNRDRQAGVKTHLVPQVCFTYVNTLLILLRYWSTVADEAYKWGQWVTAGHFFIQNFKDFCQCFLQCIGLRLQMELTNGDEWFVFFVVVLYYSNEYLQTVYA
jgi:hypothetical protein